MKPYTLLFLFTFFVIKLSFAQILCVQCYQQNDSVYAGGVNLIQNGGFENNTCTGSAHSFCPNSNNYNCNIANWICTGGGALTYAFICNNTFSFIPEGTKAAYFGNQYCNVCSTSFSDTSCLTNTGCAVSGIPSGYPISVNPGYGGTTGISLEQTIMGMTSGTTYVLEFWVGGEANGETGRGLFAVNVGFGNTMFRDKVTAPITGIGSRYDIIFNATSSSHTIKFTNWGHMGNNCTELVLDDVKLYQLNEISSQNPCSNLGIIEQNENVITLYPNPIIDELNIQINNYEPTEIILYDLSSRKLLQHTFSNSTTINTEQLAKGMYLYTVRNKNGIIKNGKVIKQ